MAAAARLALLLPTVAFAAPPLPTSLVPTEHAGSLDADPQFEPDCRPAVCEGGQPLRRLKFGRTPALGATLVEFRTHALPGQYSRPQHGIGVRSHRLEAALNDFGIEARHCLAPVVRMHTKVSSGFDLSGTLWVYLRCSVE